MISPQLSWFSLIANLFEATVQSVYILLCFCIQLNILNGILCLFRQLFTFSPTPWCSIGFKLSVRSKQADKRIGIVPYNNTALLTFVSLQLASCIDLYQQIFHRCYLFSLFLLVTVRTIATAGSSEVEDSSKAQEKFSKAKEDDWM